MRVGRVVTYNGVDFSAILKIEDLNLLAAFTVLPGIEAVAHGCFGEGDD